MPKLFVQRATDDFGEMVMPFGKYQGMRLSEVPKSYLEWLVLQEWCKPKFPKLFEQAVKTIHKETTK